MRACDGETKESLFFSRSPAVFLFIITYGRVKTNFDWRSTRTFCSNELKWQFKDFITFLL